MPEHTPAHETSDAMTLQPSLPFTRALQALSFVALALGATAGAGAGPYRRRLEVPRADLRLVPDAFERDDVPGFIGRRVGQPRRRRLSRQSAVRVHGHVRGAQGQARPSDRLHLPRLRCGEGRHARPDAQRSGWTDQHPGRGLRGRQPAVARLGVGTGRNVRAGRDAQLRDAAGRRPSVPEDRHHRSTGISRATSVRCPSSREAAHRPSRATSGTRSSAPRAW